MTSMRLGALLWLLMAVLFTAPSKVEAKSTFQSWAYQAWWLPESWKSASIANFDRVLFFEIKVNANGSITEKNGWPEKWSGLIAALNKTKTPLDLTLTLLNPKDFHSVFSSDQATQLLLDQASDLASDANVAGLHLDFEIFSALPEATHGRLQGFVLQLAKKLRSHIPAKNLSVFLPLGASSPLYSAQALAQVNHVVAQGYDAHWAAGPNAGPVAPLDGVSAVTWKKALSVAAQLGVRPEKLLLSFPLYGYEWQTAEKNPFSKSLTEGAKTTFASFGKKHLPDLPVNVQERVKTYSSVNDSTSGSSYYQFQKNNQWVTGWYEGEWSMNRKIQFMQKEKFAGMAFFVLGYDNNQLTDQFNAQRGLTSSNQILKKE